MNKRILLILLPLVISFAVIFGIYKAAKPKLQNLLLSQINRITQEKFPVKVKIGTVDWSLFFPEIELGQIEITKKEMDLPPIKVENISASLDLIALFGGRLAISSLLLEKPEADLDLDKYLKLDDSKPAEPLPLQDFFQVLKKVPVSRLGIKSAKLSAHSKKLDFSIQLGSGDLLVIRGKERLNLQLDFTDSAIQYKKTGNVPFRLQGDAVLTANSLDVSNLKLGALNSLVTLKGSLGDFSRVHIQPQGTIEFEVFSELDQLATTANTLFKLPEVSGKIDASGRLIFTNSAQLTSGFKFSAQRLKIDQFEIGDIQFQGSVENEVVKIPKIALTNEAGLVDIKNFELGFKKADQHHTASVKAQVISEQVDLHELLFRLGIGDLPLEIFIGAQLNCSGPVMPELLVKCEGRATGDQLEVRTGETYEDTLVQVDEFKANGELTVTAKDVRYKAQLTVKDNQGTSDGVISYKDGFKINYASPAFDFKNIRRLAGLQIEGITEVKGSTQGNSDTATFEMNLKTKDLFFEDFYLGSPSGKLSYAKSFLYFKDVEAQFPVTQYKLNLDIDLKKKRLKAIGSIPKFDVPELLSIFKRQFTLPIAFLGTGSAEVSVEGPFQLGKLSYDLNASIIRGELAGETFDRAEVVLHSESGEAVVQRAVITKNKNEIIVSGVGHPNGDIALSINGKSLPIEQSENIAKIGSQISGLLDVETKLTGFILDPDISMKGRIYQLVVEEQEFAESTFDTQIDKQMMAGQTKLFGGQLTGQFKIPFTDTAPFQLNLDAQDWNYTTLFALVGGGSLLNEYKASLTGNLDLASESGGLWTASGNGTIRSIFLQRGTLNLRNPLPMELRMTNGVANLTNFRIEGEQTFFEMKGKQISKEAMNLRLDGQANMRLFQIFVPFLEELAGTATVAADVSGPLLKPEVLGNANIRNGFAKLKGFPHPFEKTQADVQFSQSKIIIAGFLGNIAGGTFEGDGSVLIEGPKNLPTSIKAHLEGVNLNVPDRVRTTGDADIVFSGNWFPFTLSGTYHVNGGLVDKELMDESAGVTLKQSSYLPKMILQSAFEPVLLDLNIILEEPLQIKNSMVEGSVTGSLLVRGPPTSPALTGQLVAQKGTKAIFRDKVFDVQSANVKFAGEYDINPEVYVSARSRIAEYDINMLIQGKSKDPAIKLSSVPPLSDQDIISLIALGVTSKTLENQVGEANKAREATMQAVATGALFHMGPVKQFQKSTGVEIQVTSSYDDTKKVSIQRVTLSKKLSDKVRASATQTAGSLSSQEVTLQYNFTESLSAIGRFEDRKYNNNSSGEIQVDKQDQSILGVDLEFKKEFK